MSVFEVFLAAFSHICIEYGDLPCKSPYSESMRQNTDPKNSERGHFSRSDCIHKKADPFCCGYNITELIFDIYCNFEVSKIVSVNISVNS